MNSIIHYFENIPSWQRSLILAGGITFFWLLESAVPLFKFTYNKWRHAGTNFFFTFTTLIVNFFFALLIVYTSQWAAAQKFGILQWLQMPAWLFMIAGLLLLDLIGAYTIHFIQHKVKWMWRFHVIHHADTHVDTTTANRHHPVESVFRAAFAVIAVFITGAPVWLVMMYQSVSVVLSQFNHANIKMPLWLDNILRLVFVTPNMHRVHHHYQRPATDSNYGNIFSFWDKIFGTYHVKPMSELHYGLDMLANTNDENILEQLKIPFEKNTNSV
ncbi:MAG TPA: sterol desaturase family protein [Chitinophagaceae bacterium]|nr:sterol desaturase family protein [Chitinophagaceae bacterium]